MKTKIKFLVRLPIAFHFPPIFSATKQSCQHFIEMQWTTNILFLFHFSWCILFQSWKIIRDWLFWWLVELKIFFFLVFPSVLLFVVIILLNMEMLRIMSVDSMPWLTIIEKDKWKMFIMPAYLELSIWVGCLDHFLLLESFSFFHSMNNPTIGNVACRCALIIVKLHLA